jgi:hypothetical protein
MSAIPCLQQLTFTPPSEPGGGSVGMPAMLLQLCVLRLGFLQDG